MRLFIGIELPENIIAELYSLQNQGKKCGEGASHLKITYILHYSF
jgi:2'-5' RNA ligase